MSTASVASLFSGCGPSAISRCLSCFAVVAMTTIVATVILFPVDAVFVRGTPAHISQEGFVGRSPALAYGDSASTVLVVASIRGAMASVNHANPRLMLSGRAAVSAFAVGSVRGWQAVAVASAASAFAASQSIGKSSADVAAVASTKPFASTSEAKDGKASKSLAGQIHESRMLGQWSERKMLGSHGVNLLQGCVVVRAEHTFQRMSGSLYYRGL